MTFLEFNIQFPTEQSVIDYFVEVRFPKQPYCIHCGSKKKFTEKEVLLNVDFSIATIAVSNFPYFTELSFITHKQI
jgi:hypothetical protein